MTIVLILLACLVPILPVAAAILWEIRARHMECWLPSYVRDTLKRRKPRQGEEVHLLLCVADHFEPYHDNATRSRAQARMHRWMEDYPRLFGHLRDSDGRPPRHTFFYPVEQYDWQILNSLTALCAAGYGEVEVHLHHERDTAAELRKTLLAFKETLAARHGLLARDRKTGEIKYGFIHGDWALDNSRPDGLCCGVDNELQILRETGCYADFTLPSAPSPTQTRKINSIYYARGLPGRRKSHDWGIDAGTAPSPADALLLIQGPLLLDWKRRKRGVFPRLENGCIQGSQPPSIERVHSWLRAGIGLPGRPDWRFVKLHAHGGPETDHGTLLGEPMVRFHEALARHAKEHPEFHYHYVTAREMCNLVHAAEEGWQGTVAEARDYRLTTSLNQRRAGPCNSVACTQPSPIRAR